MCFSAEADLVMGVVVTGIGIDTLRHVRQPSERPLAALPLVLGLHELLEAVVWRRLEQQAAWHGAVVAYLLVALGVLPVLVPLAVGALEPRARRARVRVLTVLGVVIAVFLVHAVVRGPVEAVIEGHHIDYRVDVWFGGLLVALYVLVTCGSLLLSAHPHVRRFGVLNLAVVVVVAVVDQGALISLWCGWAALTSAAIAVHLRYGPQVVVAA